MGAGKGLLVVGGLLLAAVAAGVWFVLDSEAPGAAPRGGTASAKDAAPGVAEPATKSGRKRTKVQGTAAVFGQVKRRKGAEDAVGQAVTLAAEGADPWTAQTDAQGGFRLEELPDGGPYELRVQAAGFATVRLPGIALSRGEQRDVGTLWLDLAARATISVRTILDEPVAGATVEAFAAPDYAMGWDWTKMIAQMGAVPVPVATAISDKDGKAAFPELASGMWSFVATKAGYSREGRTNVRLEGGDDPSGLRIILRNGHPLKGRVLDSDRNPVPGALVLAGRQQNPWDTSGSALRVRASADAEGKFALDTLSAGDWTLLCGAPGAVPVMTASVRVPAVKEIDLVLRAGGRLAGTVTNADDGKPVEGVVVRAMCWGMSARFAEATSGADGKYVIEEVPDVAVNDVQITKEGFVLERDGPQNIVTQVPRGDTVVKDLKVRAGGSATGLVTGPDGPVAGAKVTVYVGLPTGGASSATRSATSDAEGKFAVTGLEKGRAIAQVAREGMYQKDFPDGGWWQAMQQQGDIPFRAPCGPGVETKLEVRMEKGVRVSGRVDGPEGPVEGAKVNLWGLPGARTDKEGKFALEGVKPTAQNAWFQVTKDGFIQGQMQQVTIPADQPLEDVVLKLVKQPVVRGKLVSSTGAALSDARVALAAAQQQINQWGMESTDQVEWQPVRQDGTYELKLQVSTGKVIVRAAAADHAVTDAPGFDVTADRSEYTQDMTLEPGAPLTGRVLAAGAATGVAGARVSTRRSGGQQVQMGYDENTRAAMATVVAVSDAQGMFTVEHVASGKYAVEARADAYVRASKEDVKVPDGTPLTLELQPEMEIEGRIAYADGTPVPGLTVYAQKAEEAQQQNWWGGAGTTTTSNDGRFRLRGLAAGQYRVTAQATWGSNVNVVTKKSDPVAAGSRDVKLVVDRGLTISGRVLDSQRKPVVSAWVNAQAEDGKPQTGYTGAQTKEDGTFEIGGLVDGTYKLHCQMQSFDGTSRARPVQRPNVAAGTKDLEIVLEEGMTIEGVVVDAAGKPLSMVQVTAAPLPEEGKMSPDAVWGQNAMSGADGRFRIAGLVPGRYALQAGGWNQQGKQVLLAGGESIPAGSAGVRLQQTAGLTIAGVVVDETGAPIQGAQVHVQFAGNAGNRVVMTNADGTFEAAGLPEGKVTLYVWVQGRANRQFPDIAAGTRDLRVEMVKGLKTTGRVLDASGRGLPKAHLAFQRTDGKGSGNAQTDDEGRFVAENLSPGEYKATVYVMKEGGNGYDTKEGGTLKAGDENAELRIP